MEICSSTYNSQSNTLKRVGQIGLIVGIVLVILGCATIFGPLGNFQSLCAISFGVSCILFFSGMIALSKSAKTKRASIDPIEHNRIEPKSQYWWEDDRRLEWNMGMARRGYSSMHEGYVLTFGKPDLLVGKGGKRPKNGELTGAPSAHDAQSCAFCKNNVPSLIDWKQWGCRLIASHHNTPLIIPTENPIPVHWFQANQELQSKLMKAAQSVMQKLQSRYPQDKFWFELHCGTLGFQTVWHLHLRIHREGGWQGINWQAQ